MDTEIELALTLAAAHNEDFRARIAKLFPKASQAQEQALVSIYYDTPALDLAQRRMGLRLRQVGNQWVQTVKFGQKGAGGLSTRVEVEHITHGQALELANIANLEARNFLCDNKIATRLQPTFATRIQRTLWLIEDRAGNLVELALDVGAVECEGRQLPVNEIEIELKRGSVEAVFAVAHVLARKFSLLPQLRSKAERGYRLFQQIAPKPEGARNPPLDEGMTPWQARQTILLECLRHLQVNLVEIGHDGDDMEFVHQARVAIRRMRSANKAFAALPEEARWDALETELQSLGAMLGDVRDRDVMVRETFANVRQALGERLSLEKLAERLMAQRQQHMQAVKKTLADPRTGLMLLELLHWLHEPDLAEASGTQLRSFASKALTRRAAVVDKLARNWGKLDDVQRHTLRKQVKKLRYAAEFFSSLFDAGMVKKYLGSLQAIQDMLGTMNDVAVCRTQLQQLAMQYPDTAYAAGVVVGWHEERLQEAFSHAAEAFSSLRNAESFW